MPYNPLYLTQLQEIINLVSSNRIGDEEEALGKFRTYIQNIKEIGDFSSANWAYNWRQKVYEFGSLFAIKDAEKFFRIMNEETKSYNNKEKESIKFIESEIIWNFFPQGSEYIAKDFEELVSKYPHNPEFHNSYSHYLEQKGNLPKAISEARTALRMEENNVSFIENCFNKEKTWIDILLAERKFQEGRIAWQNMSSCKQFMDGGVFQNILVSIGDRIKDHEIIQKKIDDIPDIVKQNSESDRVRLIEVLGVFSAIIAFILVNTAIGRNFSVNEALLLMLCMGIILIIFVISISYIFTSEKTKFYKSAKGYLLLTLLVFLIFLITLAILTKI